MTHRGPFQPLLFCDSVILYQKSVITGNQQLPIKGPVTFRDLRSFANFTGSKLI